jgi:TatD DNase family protein
MTPVPFRGKRNKPTFTELVVKNAAELRNTTAEELINISTKNLKNLFFRVK